MERGKQGIIQRDVRSDQESKRARGALSCAECRRLKLKCDKKVPCSSCQRRGCASICPNGSLTTGQGTRFVLADTERLHRKMAEMSDRIRQLEEALANLQAKSSGQTHPLLHHSLLSIKTLQEMHINPDITLKPTPVSATNSSEYIDAFGTLAIRDDGASTFYGPSAGSESLLLKELEEFQDVSPSNLPESVASYSEAFPFTPMNLPSGGMRVFIEGFLPPWERACDLCHLYLEQAPWFFGPVTRDQLINEVLNVVYQNPSLPTSDAPLNSQREAFSSHELALLFIVFAIGALTDQNLPLAPNNAEAEHFYQLTRAALSLESVLERPPSVTTVQTLSMMGIYQGMALKDTSIESTWSLMGLATKLAQSIGLHRDSARWKLEPKEVQKRRALFWELFITDSWQSLATGRPPSFTLSFVDCELPHDPEQTMDNEGHVQPSFPAWKARFGAECVTAVVEGTLTARSPKYPQILDLDRKVRDLPLPKYAKQDVPSGGGLAQVMRHYMPINYRGFILVYLHRSFFAQALCDHPTDPFRSQYAPSFLAAYESACSVVTALREQFHLFPESIARFWPLWTHAFSSTIIIGSVVTRGPRCKVAPAALAELRAARELFERAAEYGGRASKAVPILIRLHDKAQSIFESSRQPVVPRLSTIRAPDRDDEQDELAVFGGRTRLLATKQAPPPPSPYPVQKSTPPSYASSSSSPSGHEDSPPPPPMSFENVHPHLVGQFYGFDERLAAQVGAGSGYVYAAGWQPHQNQQAPDPRTTATYYQQPVDPLAAPPSYPLYDVIRAPQQHALGFSEHAQHTQLHDKSHSIPATSLQETWSSFMQHLEDPSPPHGRR